MAELLTIARPYAEAAFRIAREENDLAGWGAAVSRIAVVAADDTMRTIIGSPSVPAARVAEVVSEAARDLSTTQRQFVRALAENGRLQVMDEVQRLFMRLQHAEEGSLDAHVSSAFELSDAQRADIVTTLEAKYGRKVNVEVSVDPELIGGVSIRVGDEVMDASVRGKLQRMASALKV